MKVVIKILLPENLDSIILEILHQNLIVIYLQMSNGS